MKTGGPALAVLLLPLLPGCSGADPEPGQDYNQASASERADRVRRIVAEQLGVPADRVTDSAGLLDLGADSLDFVELIMRIEKEFSIPIPDEEAERMLTVGDVVAYVERPR